ncbi:MAG: hypothetical protein Q8O19_01350 [Rectinemataceae bacterium]|nr:hypothetical protein [Rectinemataceae bacterium]
MSLTIVVTGAMGHIGSYLVRDLAHQFPECEVVMIDNLLTQRFSSLFDLPAAGREPGRARAGTGLPASAANRAVRSVEAEPAGT